MALFFNLQKLEEQSCNDATKLIRMLYIHFTKEPLSKYNRFHRSKVPLNGHSFILNPSDLFNDRSTDILFKVQYIKLAGRRDYGLYKQYGYKRLQRSYFPDLDYNAIKHNPLLTITENEIILKYEEENGTKF